MTQTQGISPPVPLVWHEKNDPGEWDGQGLGIFAATSHYTTVGWRRCQTEGGNGDGRTDIVGRAWGCSRPAGAEGAPISAAFDFGHFPCGDSGRGKRPSGGVPPGEAFAPRGAARIRNRDRQAPPATPPVIMSLRRWTPMPWRAASGDMRSGRLNPAILPSTAKPCMARNAGTRVPCTSCPPSRSIRAP